MCSQFRFRGLERQHSDPSPGTRKRSSTDSPAWSARCSAGLTWSYRRGWPKASASRSRGRCGASGGCELCRRNHRSDRRWKKRAARGAEGHRSLRPRCLSLVNDRDRAARIGAAARSRIREQFLAPRHLMQQGHLIRTLL